LNIIPNSQILFVLISNRRGKKTIIIIFQEIK